MPSINTSDNTVTKLLKAGQRIAVTMDDSSTALVQWFLGDSYVSEKKFSASEAAFIGEFRTDTILKITCLTGSLTYTDPDYNLLEIVGRATKTNDDADTGEIGEYKSSNVATASSVSLVTGTAKNITSLSLTRGDWDVRGQVNRNLSGATVSIMSTGISLTSNTMSTQTGASGLRTDPLIIDTGEFGATITGVKGQRCGTVRVTSATTTTLYLVAQDTFSAGTVTAFGSITARLVR